MQDSTAMRVLLALALAGCFVEEPPEDRSWRGYTTASSEHALPLGEWVEGTDGTFGWRSGEGDADGIFQLATEKAVNHRCRIDVFMENEMRGVCQGVRILVRHDTTHVYRLCEPGTEVPECVATWGAIRR